MTTLFKPSAWQSFAAVTDRLRRRRQQRAELRQLDPTTLRDLGIDRSELGSFAAEAAGAAACTRRRVCDAWPE